MLVIAALQAFAGDPDTGVTAAPAEVWIGHQETVGTRRIPLIGTVKSVTHVYTVARVEDRGTEIVMTETPCKIDIKGAAGVRLEYDPAAVTSIPGPTIHFTGSDEALVAAWPGGWGDQDVDQDGKAGLEVAVIAPICSGNLDIASETWTTASARRVGDELVGDVTQQIHRRILHASNPCLGLVSKEQKEAVPGTFRYRKAPEGTTCSTASFKGL
jgi:hypothetical protein